MPVEQFELDDGTVVGTGLQMPVRIGESAMPAYEDVGPMLTSSQIEEAAKSGKHHGRTRFDSSHIGNQKNKNSCNGFAGAKALQRARIRRGLDRITLSGAYLYSWINGNRDNGSMLEDGMATLMSKGCATEETVPWDKIYRSMYNTAQADAEAAQGKAFECYAVRTEQALFSALALDFDCIVAVHVGSNNFKTDSKGVATDGNGPGNHAVGADGIGWIDGVGIAADGFNSWSTSYGVEGRMWMYWNRHFAPTTRYHVFYAIRSTADNKSDQPPMP